jgi:hypothetical protein
MLVVSWKSSRSTAISLTEQLKSQLPQAQQLTTRRLVPYIVRDGQWQCGIRPAAPSMTHPARRVVPNGPVGRKLQHFKCMGIVHRWHAVFLCQVVGAPLGTTSAAFELGQQPKKVSISTFTDAPSALARIAVAPRALELQRPNDRKYKDGPGIARTRRGHWGTAERALTAPCQAHGRPCVANTRARLCFLASAPGPKLWPDVCAVIK